MKFRPSFWLSAMKGAILGRNDWILARPEFSDLEVFSKNDDVNLYSLVYSYCLFFKKKQGSLITIQLISQSVSHAIVSFSMSEVKAIGKQRDGAYQNKHETGYSVMKGQKNYGIVFTARWKKRLRWVIRLSCFFSWLLMFCCPVNAQISWNGFKSFLLIPI